MKLTISMNAHEPMIFFRVLSKSIYMHTTNIVTLVLYVKVNRPSVAPISEVHTQALFIVNIMMHK